MNDLSSYEIISLCLGVIFIVVFVTGMCDTFLEPRERFKRAIKSACGITGAVITTLVGYTVLILILSVILPPGCARERDGYESDLAPF